MLPITNKICAAIHLYQLIDASIFQIKELEQIRPKSSSENETNDDDEEDEVWGRKNNIPLLDQHTELRKLAEGK